MDPRKQSDEEELGEALSDTSCLSQSKAAQPPSIAKGLKPGMVVTIQGGKESRFCTQQTLKCNSTYPELFTITDASNGFFGLVGGSEGASTTPEEAQLSFVDAGKDGKVALKNKVTGRCCTGHVTRGMSCDASQITSQETFTILEVKSTISSKANSCKSTSTLKPQALCPFSPELWNLGATCISNHVHKDSHPQCPDAADAKVIASIKKKCRKAKPSDENKCSRLAMSY